VAIPLEPGATETEILDDMVMALVEILEQKDVITEEEWEQVVEEKLAKGQELKRFSDLPVEEKGRG